jgi:hypothetical protein
LTYVEDSPKEAKSFTDEASPRKPAAPDRKVSIHGQVIRELSLKWFYDLRKLYPGEKPEVKSTRILEEFHNLPRDFRERTWAGMKHVIINIVDSLSYQTDLKQIIRNIFKNDKIHELLKRNAKLGDEFSKNILAYMDETVTKWIIQDSPPERLKQELRPRYWPGSLAYYMHQDDRHDDGEVDLTPFRAKASSMTGRAVKYASKSGSIFNPARDLINPMMRFHQDSWEHHMVRRRLRDSHAFDRGDDKSIEWIDNQRREIGGNEPYYYYDDCGAWEADGSWHASTSEDFSDFAYGKLRSIASETSSYIQAADIAAGFARQEYERHGIIAVAGKFEYVTLNGERITQNNAERKFELWRQLLEREKRESQQIVIVG